MYVLFFFTDVSCFVSIVHRVLPLCQSVVSTGNVLRFSALQNESPEHITIHSWGAGFSRISSKTSAFACFFVFKHWGVLKDYALFLICETLLKLGLFHQGARPGCLFQIPEFCTCMFCLGQFFIDLHLKRYFDVINVKVNTAEINGVLEKNAQEFLTRATSPPELTGCLSELPFIRIMMRKS